MKKLILLLSLLTASVAVHAQQVGIIVRNIYGSGLPNPNLASTVGTTYIDQSTNPAGIYTCTAVLLTPTSSTCTWTLTDSGAGLADPGGNGIIKRTALNTTATALEADIAALWTGTCNATTFLRGDGSCQTPIGFANPMTTSGDMMYENVTPAATRLAAPVPPTGVNDFLIHNGTVPSWAVPGVPIRASVAASDTILSADRSSLVTESNAGAIAVTLPNTTGDFTNNFNFGICNIGAGTATITPTTAQINGAATLVLVTNRCAYIYSNNTNYFASMSYYGAIPPGIGVSVTAFGAKLDCSADASAAVQSAINSIPTGLTAGGTLFFPAGCIQLKSSVLLPFNTPINIVGAGQATIIQKDFDGNNLFGTATLVFGTTTTLTAQGNPGDIQLTVTSSAGFSAKDWIVIDDSTGLSGGCGTLPPAQQSCNLEIEQIDNNNGVPDGTHLRLNSSLTNTFTVAGTATIHKITPLFVSFSGFQVTNGPDCATAGECTGNPLNPYYWVNGSIQDTWWYLGKAVTAIQPARSKHGIITKNFFYNAHDSQTITGQGGSPFDAEEASSFWSFIDNDVYKMGEAESGYQGHNLVFSDNRFHGCGDDCINTHGRLNHDILIKGNIMDGNAAGTTNGSVQDVPIVISDTDYNITIEGNEITHFGKQCIAASASVLGNVTGIYIRHNHCYAPVVNAAGTYPPNYLQSNPNVGIVMVKIRDFDLTDNDIMGSFPSNGIGISITSSDGGIVNGNTVKQTNGAATGDVGIYVVGTTNVTETANRVTGWQSDGIRLDATSNNITVVANDSHNNAANYTYPTGITLNNIGNVGEPFAQLFTPQFSLTPLTNVTTNFTIGANLFSGNAACHRILGALGHFNWEMCVNQITNDLLEFIPSTAVNGTTFTTPIASMSPTAGFKASAYQTNTNCAGVGTAASPSVATCGSAAAGHFSCATNATGATCTVNTTAVTANSEIFVFESDTAVTGTALGVTCNTSTTVNPTTRLLASSVAATSFTINLGTVTTNPACFSYHIIN